MTTLQRMAAYHAMRGASNAVTSIIALLEQDAAGQLSEINRRETLQSITAYAVYLNEFVDTMTG